MGIKPNYHSPFAQGRTESEEIKQLITIISEKDKLLDFMERYHLTGLCEATEEQLREYIEEVLQ